MLIVLFFIFRDGGLIFYDSNKFIVGIEIFLVMISLSVLTREFIKKYREQDFSEDWR